MSEAAWQAEVRATAARFGWIEFHHLRSIGTRAGLPDLELLHPRRGIHLRVELKTADLTRSRLSPEQVATLDTLTRCDVTCAVWRPTHREQINAWLAVRDKPVPGLWTWLQAPLDRQREIRLLRRAELTELVGTVGPTRGVLYSRRDDTFTPRFA